MGGNAAKERRRAERQKSNSKDETPKSKSVPKDKLIIRQQKAENKIPVGRTFDHASKAKFKVGIGKTGGFKKGKQNKKAGDASSSKNKIKKPKHLSRKMKLSNDPNEMEQLLKTEEELKAKKTERAERFKAKVMEAVGGPEHFDEEAYNTLMENGGGKIETIIRAVKISSDFVNGASTNDDDNDDDEQKIETSQSPRLDSHEMDIPEVSAEEEPSAVIEHDQSVEKTTTELPPKSYTSDCSISDSSDSQSDMEENTKHKRARGRKHKGRKEGKATPTEKGDVDEEAKGTASAKCATDNVQIEQDTKTKDKRRCIGRKPLTDFEVGMKYTGTVRYVKPNLGLFLDIGCHYDAFCHISRASDDFVENLDAMFKTGDVLLDKVRVVEIDRSKKRITVSLQSDDRIKDELKSSRDHKERLEVKASKKRKVNPVGLRRVEKGQVDNTANTHSQPPSLSLAPTKIDISHKAEVPRVTSTEKSLSELKRERKLQRRAERRKQKEESEP